TLDLPRDLLGEHDGLIVTDLRRLDDDADLAAGLHRERLLDALERVADLLEVLETAYVTLEHLAPGPGAGPGERVGGVDQRGEDRLGPYLLVVRGDGVDDLRRLA